jgi:hypothetical protein
LFAGFGDAFGVKKGNGGVEGGGIGGARGYGGENENDYEKENEGAEVGSLTLPATG